MYDTLRELSHWIEARYFEIFVTIFYICMVFVLIDTVLTCWKDKMLIDYILEWYERRKKK